MTLDTRKSVECLTPEDFAAFPVWEYADDEEGLEQQDETWVRPTGTKLVANRAYSHAVANFTAACGHTLSGYVIISTLEGHPEVCQGAIFHGGESLFILNPEACGFEESRQTVLGALGLAEPELFPLTWRLLVSVEGDFGQVQGILP